MSTLKQTQKRFWISFLVFVVVSLAVILAKQVLGLPDIISRTSPILIISPLIFIAAVIVAYSYYDRLSRKAKAENDQNHPLQWRLFLKAHTVKFILLTIGGLAISFTLLFYWKKDYLYVLAIILVFFLLAYPTQLKYDQQFSHLLEKRFSPRAEEQASQQSD